MEILLLALLGLVGKCIEAVSPVAVKALKDFVSGEGEKINLKYPELGEQLHALTAKLVAAPHDPAVLGELSAFSVHLHDFIRREYPPDVSGDQSQFEDRVHRDPCPGTEAAPPGLSGPEK